MHGEKLCRDCTIQEEEKQREIMDYIHDHQGCSITDVIKELNLSKRLVKHMIDKGFFGNLKRSSSSYSCQVCGKPIGIGNTYCGQCLRKLRSDTKRMAEQQAIRNSLESANKSATPISTIDKLNLQVEKEVSLENQQRTRRRIYESIINNRNNH